MEDVEKCPQSHPGKYDWLRPEPTQNTQGNYTLILPAILINQTHMVLNERSKVRIKLYAFCADVIVIWICSASLVPACDTPLHG